jgi:hypothetical protein
MVVRTPDIDPDATFRAELEVTDASEDSARVLVYSDRTIIVQTDHGSMVLINEEDFASVLAKIQAVWYHGA